MNDLAERLLYERENECAELRLENARLRASLLTVTEQVESCCSRAGLCIDADRVRAEARRS